jgi:hypothetical protein
MEILIVCGVIAVIGAALFVIQRCIPEPESDDPWDEKWL